MDFAWKVPKAAVAAGRPLVDYVIGGMDPSFNLSCSTRFTRPRRPACHPALPARSVTTTASRSQAASRRPTTDPTMAAASAAATATGCGRCREYQRRNPRGAIDVLRTALEIDRCPWQGVGNRATLSRRIRRTSPPSTARSTPFTTAARQRDTQPRIRRSENTWPCGTITVRESAKSASSSRVSTLQAKLHG